MGLANVIMITFQDGVVMGRSQIALGLECDGSWELKSGLGKLFHK